MKMEKYPGSIGNSRILARKEFLIVGKTERNLLWWAPRILAVLFLLFLAVFSLDVFSEGASASAIIIGLFMHNLPVFILLGCLIVAWRNEIVGAVGFMVAGTFYVIQVLGSGNVPWPMALSWSLIIAGPAFLIGALFLIGWLRHRSSRTTTTR